MNFCIIVSISSVVARLSADIANENIDKHTD